MIFIGKREGGRKLKNEQGGRENGRGQKGSSTRGG